MNVKSVPDKNWNIDSWRNFPIKQQPEYKNLEHLREVELKLAAFPPLISPSEIRSLKSELADAAYGKAFLLQGGDCAESFAEFNEKNLYKMER